MARRRTVPAHRRARGLAPAYPAWYLERARDHPLAAFEQPLRLTGRGDGTVQKIDTHHDAQVDDPAGVARLLSAAASRS